MTQSKNSTNLNKLSPSHLRLTAPSRVLSVRIKHSEVGSLVFSLLEMGLWTTI